LDLPAHWSRLLTAPRYPPGRRVLVRAPVCPHPAHAQFLHARPTCCAPLERLTYRGVVVNRADDRYTVELPTGEGPPVSLEVSARDMRRWNGRHHFPPLPRSRHIVQLEDGIRCNYEAPLTRAKLWEIAFALEPVVRELDFTAEACAETQRRAVRTVRGCLDLTTFQRGSGDELVEGHTRNRERYCGDDAASFAVHGQGHCHTVSSVMAAFFLPFTAALGIDLRYRGGQSIGMAATDPVADAPETHQWLEFTCRPSPHYHEALLPTTYICDLYADDTLRSGKFLDMPIASAYGKYVYPNGELLPFVRSASP